MALKEFLVLRCLAQRGLEGRMALIQPLGNWITAAIAAVVGIRSRVVALGRADEE